MIEKITKILLNNINPDDIMDQQRYNLIIGGKNILVLVSKEDEFLNVGAYMMHNSSWSNPTKSRPDYKYKYDMISKKITSVEKIRCYDAQELLDMLPVYRLFEIATKLHMIFWEKKECTDNRSGYSKKNSVVSVNSTISDIFGTNILLSITFDGDKYILKGGTDIIINTQSIDRYDFSRYLEKRIPKKEIIKDMSNLVYAYQNIFKETAGKTKAICNNLFKKYTKYNNIISDIDETLEIQMRTLISMFGIFYSLYFGDCLKFMENPKSYKICYELYSGLSNSIQYKTYVMSNLNKWEIITAYDYLYIDDMDQDNLMDKFNFSKREYLRKSNNLLIGLDTYSDILKYRNIMPFRKEFSNKSAEIHYKCDTENYDFKEKVPVNSPQKIFIKDIIEFIQILKMYNIQNKIKIFGKYTIVIQQKESEVHIDWI